MGCNYFGSFVFLELRVHFVVSFHIFREFITAIRKWHPQNFFEFSQPFATNWQSTNVRQKFDDIVDQSTNAPSGMEINLMEKA